MTTIYLINNSLTMNNLSFPDQDSLEQKREKRILSIEGEEASKKLASEKALQTVQFIYTSPFVMSIGTAKYLAQKLELEISIRREIGERILGNLGDKKIRMILNLYYYRPEQITDIKKALEEVVWFYSGGDKKENTNKMNEVREA